MYLLTYSINGIGGGEVFYSISEGNQHPGGACFRICFTEEERASMGKTFASIVGDIFDGRDGFFQVIMQRCGLRDDQYKCISKFCSFYLSLHEK